MRTSLTLEEQKASIMAEIGEAPQLSIQIAEKLNKSHGTSYDGRGIGRALSQLVREGRLRKSQGARPTYDKARS